MVEIVVCLFGGVFGCWVIEGVIGFVVYVGFFSLFSMVVMFVMVCFMFLCER